jgi:hypothetical protein
MRYDINIGDRHTFGCPVFVLDHRLQGGPGGPPTWDLRARVGIYLGRSPFHANNVALVPNPRTGHISPQYHVVFDEDFTIVPFMSSGTVPPNWAELVKLSTECATYENYKLSDSWTSEWQVPGADDGDFISDVDDKPKGTSPLVIQEEIPNNQDLNLLLVSVGEILNQVSDTLFGTTDSIAGI